MGFTSKTQIMKKILIASVIVGSLITSVASAKTQGNYIGIDVIRSNSSFNQIEVNGFESERNIYNIQSNDQISYGLNYKYAFNFNNMFIAPGAFYENTNLSMIDKDQDTWEIETRNGIKVDIGYDFNDTIAAFGTAAIAQNNYNVDWKSVGASNNDSDISPSLGLGVKFSLTDHIAFNLAYELTTVEMEAPSVGTTQTVSFDVDILKIGASYKF
jgi:opacity protein-like surface antigen